MNRPWKIAALVGMAAVAAVISGQVLLDDPDPDDLEQRAESWLRVGLVERAETELERLVEREPANVGAHYRWITVHFSRPVFEGLSSRKDDRLRSYYDELSVSEDRAIADIGRYCLGLIEMARVGDPGAALDRYELVVDRDLPYLNSSVGSCLRQLGRIDEAIGHFLREIELGGNVEGASRNLALSFLQTGETERLDEMIRNAPGLASHLDQGVLRRLALEQGRVIEYAALAVRSVFEGINLPGLIAATLILAVWLVFLRGLDVFEPEALHALALTLGLGMAMGIVCTLPYDLVHLLLGAAPGDTFLGRLLHSVLVIGVIEESVKLLPLLAVIRWTRWVNEPVDVAVYGATSALGFAFVENLMYFDPNGLASIHSRAFTATVLHMALTTIAAYGLIEVWGRRLDPGRTLRASAGWYGLAVVAHGLYDFLLMTRVWNLSLRPLALLMLLAVALAFKNAVINGLSWSPFWDDGSWRRLLLRWRYLGLSLSAILLVEYWLLAAQLGPTAARAGFLWAAISSSFLIFILTAHLGVFEIRRRRWISLLHGLGRHR